MPVPIFLFQNNDKIRQFIDCVKELEGNPYIWPCPENNYSGKGLPYSKYPEGRDCSGTVTSALFKSSNGKIDWRAEKNAQALLGLCLEIPRENVLIGDLAFYGATRKLCSHVMTVIGVADGEIELLGASGGGPKCTTPTVAKAIKASVQRKKHGYRKDFLVFGRLLKNYYDR